MSLAGQGSHSRIETPRSILILKPSSFGDVVHTLPAVAWLKSIWPESHLAWLINSEWAPLLDGNPDVNEIIAFPRRDFRGVRGAIRFVRWSREVIAGRKPDLALDYQGLLRSAIIGRASKPRTFYGMADAREGARWLYDRVVFVPPGTPHSVERYLRLTAFALGDASGGSVPSRRRLRFPLPDGAAPVARQDGWQNPFILLHPFARGTGKSLSGAQIEAFCQRLAPRRVVLVGRRSGKAFDVPTEAVDLLGQTMLSELIWIIRQAACVVSVDSGPSHLAAALGKPLVAIHTWSDPRRVGPYRPDAWVWKNGRLLPMSEISAQEKTFFRQTPTLLSASDLDAVCALVISLSDSCA